MRVHTRHTPNFGVARVTLAPGEAVQSAADTMLATSFGVTESTPSRGGARKPGLSLFTAPADGGWVDLAPIGPGDVYPLELTGTTGWSVHHGAVLARPASVRHDQGWAPLQQLFGADSGFLAHYSGTGPLVLTAPGPVDSFKLAAGEMVTVRSDYVLAYPDTVQCRLRAVDPSGPQSVKTGEGLVLDFAGPGIVLVQARNRRVSHV
ncbi:AIM24 family protein [Amycolatopsis sp. PS_44_ISF1]|uniref:AIM24 family protein n=1 Tax=Amycolatopsis sp. PS_44_ISF1 TaxID=2974917 RepID=UPI0028DED78B|nr:AIM24 family protein [Amycolatopsis sp. PS_44_ISF1]MDT8911096.1 AIM24 family protein [Amycolatopsis sp. PS_44_ISF1]